MPITWYDKNYYKIGIDFIRCLSCCKTSNCIVILCLLLNPVKDIIKQTIYQFVVYPISNNKLYCDLMPITQFDIIDYNIKNVSICSLLYCKTINCMVILCLLLDRIKF